MSHTIVRVICAIGRSGQLGLGGAMPWEGNRGPEYLADVARFFELTRGHVLLAGPKTIASIPEFARHDRELVVLRSSMDPEPTLGRIRRARRVHRRRASGLGGLRRYVSHWDVTRLPYDGPADRWFDPRWLTAAS